MIAKATPALKTVRGFNTPTASATASGDEGDISDHPSTPHLRGKTPVRRIHKSHAIDDVISANCSPVTRPVTSPSVSGISMLRSQMEPPSFSLDATAFSSRASSMTRGSETPGFRSRLPSGMAMQGYGQKNSNSGSGDETGSEATTSYEIELEDDFICDGSNIDDVALYEEVHEARGRRKMTADEFEPLRCLGKGTFGTVLLVRQRSTGRLFAQKQFKKASLVVHKRLVEQTKTERQILESVNRHPFVVKLFYAFQDHEKLYLILEYGIGGELFTHLSNERMFPEPMAAFYMAEMVLALNHLHSTLGVVYRDLKPENCLLDRDGHLLLTDFGLSKVAVDPDDCKSMLGTVEYMAPEIIQGKKYGKAVDWWSLGALGYDLMTSKPPFRGANNAKIQDNIVKAKVTFPFFMSPDAKDLLTRLLRKEPTKRLGYNMPKDLVTIKTHRFFRQIDWAKLEKREVTPPIKPVVKNPELAENFAPEFTELSLSPVVSRFDEWGTSPAKDKDDMFGGFSYVASSSLIERHGFGAVRV